MQPVIENKAKKVKELCSVDISGFKEDVLRIPQAIWDNETAKRENNFSCFHHTQHILFRMHTDPHDHKLFKDKPLWSMWESKFMPLINKCIGSYGYENGTIAKAMLAKLIAGYKIDRHVDAGPRNRRCHKIHIPIQSNEDILFFIKDEPFVLEEGKAYEVNNIVHHHVENNSSQDRIHFIFEYFE